MCPLHVLNENSVADIEDAEMELALEPHIHPVRVVPSDEPEQYFAAVEPG